MPERNQASDRILRRIASPVPIAAVLLVLAGCVPTGNAAACEKFADAFSAFDYAMESSDGTADAYATFGIGELRSGIAEAQESADGDVARALDGVSVYLETSAISLASGRFTGDYRYSMRDPALAVVSACADDGHDIQLDHFIPRD